MGKQQIGNFRRQLAGAFEKVVDMRLGNARHPPERTFRELAIRYTGVHIFKKARLEGAERERRNGAF